MGTTHTSCYPSAGSPKTPFGYATGVNYSRYADITKVTAAQARADLTQISGIARMIRVFDWNPAVMKEAHTLGLEVALGTANGLVKQFANNDCSDYVDQVTPHADIIKLISVGNEVFQPDAGFSASTVADAISNLHAALRTANVNIPVTTDCVWSNVGHGHGPSWAPRTGELTSNGTRILQTLKDLYSSDAYLLCSFYPFIDVKGWVQSNGGQFAKRLLPYALFKKPDLGPAANQFDSDYETLRIAMKNGGLEEVTILVSENGWPTSGFTTKVNNEEVEWASIAHLNSYINGYHNWQSTEGISLTTFMFEMYDEPEKPMPGDEAHYGIYTTSGTLKQGLALPDWTNPLSEEQAKTCY